VCLHICKLHRSSQMIIKRTLIVIIALDIHLEATEILLCTQNRKKYCVHNQRMVALCHWEVENVIAENIFITGYQIVESVKSLPEITIFPGP